MDRSVQQPQWCVADAVGDQIRRRAARVGQDLSESAVDSLSAYIGLLTKWNQRLNLTALALAPMSDEAVDRLVIEPLVAARDISASDRRMVDVGSGGGSPALPIKISAPWLRVTMVEVKTRKSVFLREAIRQLQLEGTDVETTRVERLAGRAEFVGAVDVVTVRAVRLDDELWGTLMKVLRPGGRVLWFGAPPAAELRDRLPVGFAVVVRRTLIPEAPDDLAILEKSH